MQAFTLISEKGNQSTFVFNADDMLIEFKADTSLTPDALLWLLERLPITLQELEKMAKGIKAKLVPLQIDLSFERFWNEYDHKVGNKTKAKKLWTELSDADKTLALNKLPLYKRFIQVKGIETVYPERYISQRRFENEFKQ